MTSAAFAIWLCGAAPAFVLAFFDCRPRSIVEFVTAAAIVVFWPLFVLGLFVALLTGDA